MAFDDRDDRLVLADDALVQPLFHVNQLLDFAFHQPADRDVRPLADDLGDVFLVDFLLQHPLALLELGQPRFLVADLLLELGHAAVLQLGRLRRSRRRAARARSRARSASSSSFSFARLLDRFLLLLPVRRQPRRALP